MKKGFLLVGAVALVTLFASCATVPGTGLFGSKGPVFSEVNGDSVKTAEASTKVWLGIFGSYSFTPAAKVAQDNGITKIATVEYYQKPGILGLWTEYFTIVTGQ
jgi:hypothetical protein